LNGSSGNEEMPVSQSQDNKTNSNRNSDSHDSVIKKHNQYGFLKCKALILSAIFTNCVNAILEDGKDTDEKRRSERRWRSEQEKVNGLRNEYIVSNCRLKRARMY
jgi:hypothetical protein